MTYASGVAKAKVEMRDGRRFWFCPNCGQKLGEIVGCRVIIVVGPRQVRMPVEKRPEQDCPRCGVASEVAG